jgi:hypothetical protein
MATDNAQTIRRLYERVLAPGGVEAPATADLMPEFFDPEIVFRQTSSVMGTAGDFHGYSGLIEAAREVAQAFAGLAFFPEVIEARGDKSPCQSGFARPDVRAARRSSRVSAISSRSGTRASCDGRRSTTPPTRCATFATSNGS